MLNFPKLDCCEFSRIPEWVERTNFHRDIRRRNDEIQEKLPPWLRISNVTSSSNSLEWMQTALKFVGLQCSFLIEQAFVKRANGDRQRLLDVARQLLAMTVSIWTAKDHFLSYFSDNDWLVSFSITQVY
jgi:hypothetical protein